MDYTLNTVSKCRFSLYLNIRGLQAGPGKFFMVSCKVLEKSWIFLSVKEWEPCTVHVLSALSK